MATFPTYRGSTMAFPSSYGRTSVLEAAAVDRSTYLRRVLLLTCAGLGISAVTSVVGAGVIVAAGDLLLSPMVFLVAFWGTWALTNFVARPMVFSGTASKWAGFALGTISQGVAMSFLLLVALEFSASSMGNPFALLGLAGGITFFTCTGLAAYAFMDQRDFSWIRAGLSVAFLPMLFVMGASFAFPGWFGGTVGLLFGGLFVVISVGALLYSLDQVIHRFTTDMEVEGAFTITIGVLTLFWNILTLLMRLRRR